MVDKGPQCYITEDTYGLYLNIKLGQIHHTNTIQVTEDMLSTIASTILDYKKDKALKIIGTQ